MLAGMYVVHDGTTCQVSGIAGGVIGYTGPAPTLYSLQPVDGGPTRYLRNPLAVDIPLTPACEVCDLPAGHNRCTEDNHQGPRKPRTLPPLRPEHARTRQQAMHGTPCSCWRWDCAECGRRMHAGQRQPA